MCNLKRKGKKKELEFFLKVRGTETSFQLLVNQQLPGCRCGRIHLPSPW